ncbi:DUF3558 family protein [Nocardia sp. NPDC056100]|uniref:DUF3558 family protein n=1 Tax=Nocardia sp. NPDC056100 TaxID=3345712 RepID=UPI0035DCEA58
MRARMAGPGLALLAALVLSACGASDSGTPAAAPSSTPHEITPALDVGLCGSADANQVGALSGFGAVTLISSDPLLCRWETSDGSSIAFRWFRNSPIGEYRSEAGASAGRAGIDIVGRAGFSWQAAHACEAAVQTGDTDFISWTVDSVAVTGANACAAADRLASATLAKR